MRFSTARTLVSAAALTMLAAPAHAHVGVGAATSFGAGFGHPFSGLDHMAAMVAVGLWAALKGGRAVWAWPAAFVAVMLAGGALGIAGAAVPFVEPGIQASVVVLGLLVALAVDLPVIAGVAVIGLFALFHGHAHGVEIPGTAGGLGYLAGFAVATALLHAAGIGAGLLVGARFRRGVRLAGAATAAIGLGLIAGAI
jgi:urease accessory protein